MSYEVWGEPEERDWYSEDEMADVLKEHEALITDLAMMICRLAHAVRGTGKHQTMINQAIELLAKNGLNGSVLRDEYTESAAAPTPPSDDVGEKGGGE